jgi:5-methylcytosine-specific restriction endonuclease McrA
MTERIITRKTVVKPHTCVICKCLYTPVKYRKSTGNYKAFTGQHTCSKECKYIYHGLRTAKRMRETRYRWIGKNNPMWTGRCLTKNKSYRGPDWNQIKDKARARDNYTCQHCGMKESAHLDKWGRLLEVHHIVPFCNFNNYIKANKPNNLITLCKSCHMKADRAIEYRQIQLPFMDSSRKKFNFDVFKGEKNPRALLTENQVKQIKRLLSMGFTQRTISILFDVKKHVISAINTGQNWSHVRIN